jgi:putative FmdB family regulatory protein
MPIYEFYCADCHTIYSFLSRSVARRKRPACPRCGRSRLERRVSAFAISKGRSQPAEQGLPDLEDGRVEQAMTALAREAESVNDEDPRQVAGLMRKFYDATGMKLGSGMEEAIRRMEAGEDADRIEQELGDLLEQEDPLGAEDERSLSGSVQRLRARLRPPRRDETLYEM